MRRIGSEERDRDRVVGRGKRVGDRERDEVEERGKKRWKES